jgi:hypothetical protein
MERCIMSTKRKNERVGICLMVLVTRIVLAGLWAILLTPQTARAARPSNPGGNVVKQDIPGVVTLAVGGGLTSDGGSYSDSEPGVTCCIGRRRSIRVTLSKNSPRMMNLALGDQLPPGIDDPVVGCDPWGDLVMTPEEVQDLNLPNGSLYEVDLSIAHFSNVSGLGSEPLYDSTQLTFLDSTGNAWSIYFGPGRDPDGNWGGERHLTNLDSDPSWTPPVRVQRVNPDSTTAPKMWAVDPEPDTHTRPGTTPGYLWYKGGKKNASRVFVGVFNLPLMCDVESLE